MTIPLPIVFLKQLDIQETFSLVQSFDVPVGQDEWKVVSPKTQDALEMFDVDSVFPENLKRLVVCHNWHSDALGLVWTERRDTLVPYPLNAL
jgi:hypothetical protein